ncbi:hypothetical protein ACJEBH_15275 [Pseudomonas guariconensis]|uniref:hypothetical protein n=1 Tax=Pseudomonas guariconensis TaxID=1288410 RepID=UPI003871B79C
MTEKAIPGALGRELPSNLSTAGSQLLRNALEHHLLERDRLAELACTLETISGYRSGQRPEDWEISGNLATDALLQRETSVLRKRFLLHAAEFASRTWLTPPTGSHIGFPGTDETYRYCYDRQHVAHLLERRLNAPSTRLGRIERACFLFGSGMAAINTLLQSLAYVTEPAKRRLGVFAGYFETHSLIRFSAFAEQWARLRTTDELANLVRTGEFSILFIEPVQYSWSFETLDWDYLIEAIAESADPPIIVLDTTLVGSADSLDALLSRLIGSNCPIVVRVRSGLKLDQEGLELASVGVLEWWARPDCAAESERLAYILETFRTISGAGLCRSAACALSAPFVFDEQRTQQYSDGILQSNRRLFEALTPTGDIFKEAVFPSLPWNSPFVLLRLRQEEDGGYELLAHLLMREAQRRNLDWIMSGSFGFRTERFETILPREQIRWGERPGGVLKVCAGRYQGARHWEIIDLLNELSTFDSIDEAERVWARRVFV